MTSKVLESQLKKNILAYADDIVVISAARQDHISDLAETFANLRKANLSLNPEKCVFGVLKRPLMREDLKVIQYQSQEADNTFITSDGTSPYNSARKWAVKRHYREDNN